jgi:hypothetical protein
MNAMGRRVKLWLWMTADLLAVGLAAYQLCDASLPFGNAYAGTFDPALVPPRQTFSTAASVGTDPGTFDPALFPPPAAVPAMMDLGLGGPAPEFTLPRIADGQPVRLADLHTGKPLVLVLSSFT